MVTYNKQNSKVYCSNVLIRICIKNSSKRGMLVRNSPHQIDLHAAPRRSTSSACFKVLISALFGTEKLVKSIVTLSLMISVRVHLRLSQIIYILQTKGIASPGSFQVKNTNPITIYFYYTVTRQ